MFARDLLEYVNATPFEPFRIHLTDGTSYEIRHPEMVKVERTKAHVFFHAGDDPRSLVLRREAIALLHINRIAPTSGAVDGGIPPGPEGNGAQQS